jgi:TM2 domain-containing membrane protein YozV
MPAPQNEVSFPRAAIAGILAWILPGLGHIYLGQKRRGAILLIVIALTFWSGVAVGGVASTVQPTQRQAWFLAQVCAGVHTLGAYVWGRQERRAHPDLLAGFVEEDVAVIYTGVAGLLNILIILDALASADPNYVRVGPRPPPQTREAAS